MRLLLLGRINRNIGKIVKYTFEIKSRRRHLVNVVGTTDNGIFSLFVRARELFTHLRLFNRLSVDNEGFRISIRRENNANIMNFN